MSKLLTIVPEKIQGASSNGRVTVTIAFRNGLEAYIVGEGEVSYVNFDRQGIERFVQLVHATLAVRGWSHAEMCRQSGLPPTTFHRICKPFNPRNKRFLERGELKSEWVKLLAPYVYRGEFKPDGTIELSVTVEYADDGSVLRTEGTVYGDEGWYDLALVASTGFKIMSKQDSIQGFLEDLMRDRDLAEDDLEEIAADIGLPKGRAIELLNGTPVSDRREAIKIWQILHYYMIDDQAAAVNQILDHPESVKSIQDIYRAARL
jgi:hypothetical protein